MSRAPSSGTRRLDVTEPLAGMTDSDSKRFTLRVLGTPDLHAPEGRRVASVLSQPKRLALLTYLALAPEPVSRGSLVALFWPESDEARARNALSQAVFYLRRSLDERIVESVEGDRLRVPPELLWCDARELLDGHAGTADGAGSRASVGELLDGWNADDSQELQEWLDAQRRRLAEIAAERADGRGISEGAGVGQAGAPPAPGRTHTLVRPLAHARLTAGLSLAGLGSVLVAVVLASAGDPGATGGAAASAASAVTEPRDLAVLRPRISSVPEAPALDGAAIHAEILVRLPPLEGLRIVAAAYSESAQDLRRQLMAAGVGAAESPRWILEVDARVTDQAARVVALLYGSPLLDVRGRASFDIPYADAEAALVDVPQEIARRVGEMVEGALSGGAGG